jgi:hypothetical protein
MVTSIEDGQRVDATKRSEGATYPIATASIGWEGIFT